MDPEGCTRMLITSRDGDERERVVGAEMKKSSVSRGPSQDEEEATGPTCVIYTAIPLHGLPRPPTDASSIFRRQNSRASSPSVSSSISSLDDEETGSLESESPYGKDSRHRNGSNLSGFQLYSVTLGLMVGIFIQLSSLGANYLLSELYGEHQALNSSVIVKFSLAWSVLTSVLGVSILYLIRELVTAASDARGRALLSSRGLVLHLECYFAIGTLSGVCIAWTCTDLLLGLEAHFLHSFVTLGMALLWCKFITNRFAPSDESDPGSVAEPLLLKHASSSLEDAPAAAVADAWDGRRFGLVALALGVSTGFFIQFSSLGANFILAQFVVPHHTPDENNRATIAAFSFVWSVFTSGMGTIILSLARGMIVAVHDATFSPDQGALLVLYSRSEDDSKSEGEDVEVVDRALERTLMRLEAWFAVGALFGVNVAWMATDLVVGLKVQYLHALLTEVVLLLAVVLSLLQRRIAVANDDDDDDDDAESSRASIRLPSH